MTESTESTNSSNNSPPQESPDLPPDSNAGYVHPLLIHQFHENSFIIEDSFYRSRLPKPTHWSVVWSDLMMTMFVLFLSMFVYQAAHKDFLISDTPEVIGGSTMDAIDIEGGQDLIVPIVPLTQNAPLITGGTVFKVEKVQLDEVDIDEVFRDTVTFTPETNKNPLEPTLEQTVIESKLEPVKPTITATETINPEPEAPRVTPQKTDVVKPDPITVETEPATEEKHTDIFSEIYDISKQTLNDHNLEKFASIEVVPDKTMRIILTGDLLFSIGQADLSPLAQRSLLKIASIIKRTPYMINVIGHTDNSPMRSPKFASNWELSVVRASTVARFLIDSNNMNPQQFVVSGYGSHRPVKPNNNIANRAANRRVEIIISKRPAPAIKATSDNLL